MMSGKILILMIVWSGYAHIFPPSANEPPVHSNSEIGKTSDWAKDGYWYEFIQVESKEEAQKIIVDYENFKGRKVKEAKLITMIATEFHKMEIEDLEIMVLQKR